VLFTTLYHPHLIYSLGSLCEMMHLYISPQWP